jgi:hypothetical protein
MMIILGNENISPSFLQTLNIKERLTVIKYSIVPSKELRGFIFTVTELKETYVLCINKYVKVMRSWRTEIRLFFRQLFKQNRVLTRPTAVETVNFVTLT